jgi:branched-chain amino acid transport system substrate-binding protein
MRGFRIASIGRNPRRIRRVAAPAVALGLATVLAAACASSGSSSTASSGGSASGSGGSAAGSGAPIKIAYLGPQSGSLASTFAGGATGAQTFVQYYNAHGGLDGHQLQLKVYDDASNASTVLANARLAVESGAQAIISADVYFSSAVPYLQQQKIPVFGAGIVASFYGPNATNFFSQEGNWIGFESDAQSKYLVSKGLKKIAVVSDANPGNSVAATAVAKGVTQAGGTLAYTNYTVDDTSSAALLSLAQRLSSLGVQGVYTNFYGTAAPQLQADLAQVGSKAVAIAGSIGVDPGIPQQFGTTINGLLSEVFSATWYNPAIPAIKTFTAAMKQYSPSNVQNAEALSGWANMVMFQGAIDQLGSNQPTAANIVAAGNKISNYTGDGLFPPVSFPAMHTQLNPCFSLAQIVSGQWKIVTGDSSNPFTCGDAVAAS